MREIARLCPGRLDADPSADHVTGVKIDSRKVTRGDLFVAVGRGGDFCADALARGAAATLVPDDALPALAALGAAVRERSDARVVAITGSYGKTTTKDILAAIAGAQRRTVAAERSFNNELGVPLTLCRLEHDTEVCIVELAMRGTALVPAACAVERDDLEVVRVGEDVRVESFEPPLLRTTLGEIEVSFTARHLAANALCALAAARALGLDLPDRLEVEFVGWRNQEVELPGGGLLINDAWNANPISMRAALEHLR